LPASSFDTFFACTILVAVTLIAVAFTATTLQAQISSTQDTNQYSYLKAIADHMLTNPGTPGDWATASGLPTDFGLAAANSTYAYELDIDKITRLNSQNPAALTYFDILHAAKLNNIALGVKLSQVMNINIEQTSNLTIGDNGLFSFSISASINSKPASGNLHGYIIADSYQASVPVAVLEAGVSQLSVTVPIDQVNDSMLVVFARADFDDRVTSYAIYNFRYATQETSSRSTTLGLNPIDYKLIFNGTAPNIAVENVQVFSYSFNKTAAPIQNSQCTIPQLVDNSPLILVARGTNNSVFFEEWVAYPQIPMQIGSSFENSATNIFSYLVTVDGVLYRLELSLGDVVY
jgi:hypothetical protein